MILWNVGFMTSSLFFSLTFFPCSCHTACHLAVWQGLTGWGEAFRCVVLEPGSLHWGEFKATQGSYGWCFTNRLSWRWPRSEERAGQTSALGPTPSSGTSGSTVMSIYPSPSQQMGMCECKYVNDCECVWMYGCVWLSVNAWKYVCVSL